MEKLWLLGIILIVAISNTSSQELTVLDEYYLVGLRDLYKFANLTVGDQVPYAVLALDFAGYRDIPDGFQRPGQERFRRTKETLWPCKADYSSPIDQETTVVGVQDFNKDGMMTYHVLLAKYNEILYHSRNSRAKHMEVHIFFSHLPNPAIFYAFKLIAKQLTNVTYTIGYYHNAPKISGVDVTETLHNTALDLAKEQANINFGRIEGKSTSAEGLKRQFGACNLETPKVKYPGYPEPEVFNAMYVSMEPKQMPSFQYRDEPFQGNDMDFCGPDGNSQLATVQQLRRSANNGYSFPCSYLADGIAREAVETCHGKVEVRVCDKVDNARFLCSGKKASVKYIEGTNLKYAEMKKILGKGIEQCMKTFGTYVVGIKELEEAIAVGYYNTKCGYTTDGKMYKVIPVGSNDTSLMLVECSDERNVGFYCSLNKPEVFRWPLHRGEYERLYRRAENANKACVDEGFHLATLKQLRHAWSRGLHYCDCGFLSSGAVMYPITSPRDGCEMYGPGLRQCPRNPSEWSRSGWAAYCSNIALPIVPHEMDFTDWQAAMDACKEQNRGLARFEHYMEASELGFRDPRCLMTANGQSYRFDESITSCSSPSNFYCSRYQVPVFHIKSDYTIEDLEEAEEACHERGSTLATEELLELAYQLGYDQCSCGFLRGGQVRYPINRPRDGCGEEAGAGLRDCPVSPRTWNRRGWDAYCVSIVL